MRRVGLPAGAGAGRVPGRAAGRDPVRAAGRDFVRAAGRDERGFALLVVLWTLVLVSLLVLRLTEAGTAEARLGSNLRRGAVAEAEADGAFATAAFRLLASGSDLPGAGRFTVPTPHGAAVVTFRSEAGKVDLNNASPPLVAALIAEFGEDETDATNIAAAIAAWHTPVPGPQLPTLLAPYRAAGRRYGPPGSAFESVDELRLVLGVTPELFARLQPYLTVFASSDPALSVAAPPVLQAAASIGELPVAGGTTPQVGDVFDLRVDERADGARFLRDGVVQLESGENGAPWRILTWNHPVDAPGP